MNTILAGLKSWKSTIIGVLLGALIVVQKLTTEWGLEFDDPQLWIAVGIAALGVLTRDADKSSQDSGIRLIGLLLVAGCLLLPSCAEYPITGSISYRDPSSGAKGGLVFRPGETPAASIRVPIYDDETGELIGLAELEAPVAKVTPEK